MTNWPVGLSTGCFWRDSILKCLEPIRSSGFSLVEVCTSPAHLNIHHAAVVREAAALAVALGMEVYSLHAPFAIGLDISSPDTTCRESSVQEILCAVDAAAAFGAHHLVVHPGSEIAVPDAGEERMRRIDHAVRSLSRIADACARAGIGCAVENKLPHLLFGNIRDMLRILNALNTCQVGACLDTGHAALSRDLQLLIHSLGPKIRLVHAHDNHGHGDEHLPPGDGCIKWERVLRELAYVHFHSVFILEIASEGDGETILATARRGRSYLRRVARHIALERFLH